MKITQIEAFQIQWSPTDKPSQRSAFVRVHTDAGLIGLGEASPMQGGRASLGMIVHDIAPMLVGRDPLDHAVLLDQAMHTLVKLGPEGALTGALAALDIAFWDLKGKITGLPIYKLIGGAWRTAVPFYASIGGNGDRDVDAVLRVVEQRLKDKPAAIKIRFDNNRTTLDADIPGDIAKARAVRKLVGDGFPLAFDANNCYTTGGAVRGGRAVADLNEAAVRMVQPDIVKMGGITGLLRCAALAHAHGVELVPPQTQPTIGHTANLHVVASLLQATKPAEWNDPSPRTHAVFDNPPVPVDGLFHLPAEPGLGLTVNEAALAARRVEL